MKSYIESGNSTLFVVFHGTGGDEKDLVPLVKFLNESASILSLRGEVSEQGMLRFFRRLSFGVFDEQSIRSEAEKIHIFLSDKLDEYEKVIFLGYSNGANMIVALMQLYPTLIKKAVLMHPMRVLDTPVQLETDVIVTYGLEDQMIPANEAKVLIAFLQQSGASVTEIKLLGGHEVSQDELLKIKAAL